MFALRRLVPVALLCLAGCPLGDPIASCAEFDLCTTSSGPTSASTGAPTPPTGGIQTVTGDDVSTSTTAAPLPPPMGTTTGEAEVPAILSVLFTPDPLEQVGIIDVDVVAEADHVRMDRPGFPSVELSKGQGGHFHGAIEIFTGLSNGTHEATFVPRIEDAEGTPELGNYTVMLPEAGQEVVWDTIPDDGLGQVEALAVLGEDAIIGLATVFDGNDARCYLHRRNLDGSSSGDAQILFPEYHCTAVDILTADGTIYVLVHVTGGDGPRWRLATMTWGAAPVVLRTGVKDEAAHALARSAHGTLTACGTGPSPAPIMDTIDGRTWTYNGPSIELDYKRQPPNDSPHQFDETVTDCAFAGDRLVLVGEVFGPHEEGEPDPLHKRPFVVEIDGQAKPHWIVAGLGPGNTTQGGARALAIDDQGRAVVGLYTCGDVCDPEPELRIYEPSGDIAWQVTLPADVSVPFDVAWSPAGYAVVAGAHGMDLSTQFLLQGYVPGTYTPAWTFAKGKQAGLHIALAVAAAPGVVVGGGLGVDGYPAFAFVAP